MRFCASIPIFGAPTVSVTAASIAAPKCSPVSVFRPDGTSTARTGIFDSLTAAMNFFQPSSSARFKPMPNKPSIMRVGQASCLSETGWKPVHFVCVIALEKFCQRRFWIHHVQQDNFSVGQKFLCGAGVIAVMALAGEDQNRVAGTSEFAGAGGDFWPTRRMTPASVWPVAQVARSHSRIWARLTTGTGMACSVAKFSPAQKENVVKGKLSREEREGGEVNFVSAVGAAYL